MPTSALRASVHRTLQLLDTRPPIDSQAYAACRRWLGTLLSQRAIEDDWIARLQAPQPRSARVGDAAARTALDAEIEARKEQRRRLLDRERHAVRTVEEHERRLQVLYDWQLDHHHHHHHHHQLVEGRWHAQMLLERQDRALDGVAAAPPPYLLAALGAPPRAAEARAVWRQSALAVLRFRKDSHIQDPDQALGPPPIDASQRLRRSQVEVLVDQARQLIHQHSEPFPLTEPFTTPDMGLS
jgi:hypothetical protein